MPVRSVFEGVPVCFNPQGVNGTGAMTEQQDSKSANGNRYPLAYILIATFRFRRET